MTASKRGQFWTITALILAGLLLVACVFVPIPFLARSPGPVFDILGEYDGKQVLVIDGARSYPTTGVLDMTTVAESGGSAGAITVGTALFGLFSPTTSVVPDENPNAGEADRDFEVAVFDASQSNALGAAAAYLDRPVTVKPVVTDVVPDSPSAGVLKPGDIIEAIDDQKVADSQAVAKVITAAPVGTTFTFTIRRKGAIKKVDVTSTASSDDGRPVVGIVPGEHYTSDFKAKVNLDGIGGPSAGLMLAVGMVDRLTPGDLLGDRHVAGTGQINGAGEVGEIGGIDKKLIAARDAGAELFVAPSSNCKDVVGHIPDGLTVVPASSLTEAIKAVEAWRAGLQLPNCPVAAAPETSG